MLLSLSNKEEKKEKKCTISNSLIEEKEIEEKYHRRKNLGCSEGKKKVERFIINVRREKTSSIFSLRNKKKER